MNFYLTKVPVVPVLGLFSANCTVFWCKLHCVLVLNAVHFGAKCRAKSIKMHCKGINITLLSHEKQGSKGQNSC